MSDPTPTDRLQYLIDHWPVPLEDGGVTFPDGEFWPQTSVIPPEPSRAYVPITRTQANEAFTKWLNETWSAVGTMQGMMMHSAWAAALKSVGMIQP